MAGVAEENRRRIAAALCLLGVGLILTGAVLILQHRVNIGAGQGPLPRVSDARDNVLIAQAIQRVLFWVLVLVGVFGVSTFAFLRWSRRFRNWLLSRPHPPTPAEDLWAMHRLPDEPPADAGPYRETRNPHCGG